MKRWFLLFCLFLLTAVLLCGCLAKPQSNIGESSSFVSQIIRTNETSDGAAGQFPDCLVIRSQTELYAYYNENQAKFYFGQLLRACPVDATDFYTAIQKYDETWFKTHDLLLARVRESSGSVQLQVTGVAHTKTEGMWTVNIREKIPEVGTQDMAFWHILVEVPKCECIPHGARVVLE